MATQRQLKARWLVSPGKEIFDDLVSIDIISLRHGHSASELFRLLDNLPFREEVPNGRDFRGINIAARECDFVECNFSFAHVSYFYFCRLDHSVFDGCVGRRATFHSSLNSCSFVDARLRNCYFTDSSVKDCGFINASLPGCSFQNADLRGSRFTDSDCRSATFAGANLLGCDFRGVNLDQAVFCDVLLDKTTDFRGAKMSKVLAADWRDSNGNVVRRGVDFNQATT